MHLIKNDGTVMTLKDKREQFPDGKCPLCFGYYGWVGSLQCEEGEEPLYVVACKGCNAEFPDKE